MPTTPAIPAWSWRRSEPHDARTSAPATSRTHATTVSLCTSRPAQRGYRTSIPASFRSPPTQGTLGGNSKWRAPGPCGPWRQSGVLRVAPGPTNTRARSHHRHGRPLRQRPHQRATGFIHGGSAIRWATNTCLRDHNPCPQSVDWAASTDLDRRGQSVSSVSYLTFVQGVFILMTHTIRCALAHADLDPRCRGALLPPDFGNDRIHTSPMVCSGAGPAWYGGGRPASDALFWRRE